MSNPESPPPRLAYLVSQYPMLSMIFIIREVVELRRLGFEIDVVSINNADRNHGALSELERQERSTTHYVKAEGVASALLAHLAHLLRAPHLYFRGWLKVFTWAGADPRRLFMHCMYFTEALMVGRWMHNTGHRHLHVHLGNEAATVGMYVKHVFGFGLSITIHGPDEFYDSRGQLLGEKVAAADFICCISDFARSQLMKASNYEHWHKLEVCRLGVDTLQFPGDARPDTGGRPFVVLCVGRLTPAKGQHILLAAVATLRERGRDIHLRIVGDGVDRKSLERHVAALALESRVTFEGPIAPDRIRDFYATSDLFVLPSFAEGVPVVLMEAMSMGLPVVSTTVAGIPELIRNGQDGLLVAPSDPGLLANAIERLMDDAELRSRLALSARERIADQYNLRVNVARLAGIFRARV
jgi:colanic acid/amylovoran biosynthesis glycosyltransferase